MKKAFFGSALGWFTAATIALIAVVGGVSIAHAAIMTDSVTTTINLPMFNVAQSGIDYTIGSTGNGVLVLEQFLQNRGYFPSSVSPDTVFDATTAQALAAYQAQAHVQNTGYFGPMTRAHMAVVLWFKMNGFPTVTQ